MTLNQLFDVLAANPIYIILYCVFIPLIAVLAGFMGKNEGHLSPWKYLYSVLIYLACIPGIFAVTLSIYIFLFERRSILDTDVYTQILPLLSMILTLIVIRRNVDLDEIPGFEKISGLVMVILAALAIMWIVDRTRLIVFSFLPFSYALGIFAVLLIILRIGWKRLFTRP